MQLRDCRGRVEVWTYTMRRCLISLNVHYEHGHQIEPVIHPPFSHPSLRAFLSDKTMEM